MLSQVFQEMGWSSVKPEQKEVVEAILKTDVFVILPRVRKECLLPVFASPP